MSDQKIYRAIGLMSGTSLDGEIDVALIETDGRDFVKPLDFYAHPYDLKVRDIVRPCFGKREVDEQAREAAQAVTDIHAQAVKASGFDAELIGFHGQTITHAPEDGFTWQLGDGAALAEATGISVVNDFRAADMKEGGQGAPLAPLYHQAIMADQDKPVCVLNLGGVANVTYINANKPAACFASGNEQEGNVIAFDCGPANALMDDYMLNYMGKPYDENGALAESGKADRDIIDVFLAHPFFKASPPKSLDRNEFNLLLEALPDDHADAMATLAVMSAVGIMASVKHFPQEPHAWYLCGGGRKNAFMVRLLEDMLRPARIQSIDALGFNGDATEAECFAYLAVRSVMGLPLSMPSTTGVVKAISGGVLCRANEL